MDSIQRRSLNSFRTFKSLTVSGLCLSSFHFKYILEKHKHLYANVRISPSSAYDETEQILLKSEKILLKSEKLLRAVVFHYFSF